MTADSLGIQFLANSEHQFDRRVMSIWGWVKKAAKWVKDHVVGGAKWIGVKFRF